MKTLEVDKDHNDFKDDGYCLYRNVFPPIACKSAIDWIAEACNSLKNRPGLEPKFEIDSLTGTPPVRKIRRILWNDIPFWSDLFKSTGIFSLGSNFVLGDATLIRHAAFLKPKKIGGSVAFHQDQILWEYEYPKAINLWIALEPTTSKNGCMELCPGSHHNGQLPHNNDPQYSWHPSLKPNKLMLESPKSIDMDQGDVLIWDRYTVHGSGPNKSEQDRKAMVLVFANSSTPDFKTKDQFSLKDLY